MPPLIRPEDRQKAADTVAQKALAESETPILKAQFEYIAPRLDDVASSLIDDFRTSFQNNGGDLSKAYAYARIVDETSQISEYPDQFMLLINDYLIAKLNELSGEIVPVSLSITHSKRTGDASEHTVSYAAYQIKMTHKLN